RGCQAGARLYVALHALEHGQGMLVALCKGSLEAVELCDLLPGRSERGDLLAGGREPRPGQDRGIRVRHLGPGGLDDLGQLLVGVAEPGPDLQPREVTQVVLDGGACHRQTPWWRWKITSRARRGGATAGARRH